MAAPLLQPSFAGGELAPALWGRVDLDRYGIGARRLENWIVRPYGGIETRPGTRYVAEAKYPDRNVLLLPFTVSEDLAYVVEMGHLYMRFHYAGGPLLDNGIPVEIVTPWDEDDIAHVRFTQSADTMFLVHPDHQPRMLRRTGPASFALSEFVPREGPFRSLNANEAHLLAASGTSGTVTITSNLDLFTADMVGALVYMEQKSLGLIRPWVQGERSGSSGLQQGALRRSEGKIYRAVTVKPHVAPDYTETGNVRPTHEVGREWDGPGDTRVFDTINYTVGVEWEYVNSGYGVAQITEYVDAKTVRAVVQRTLPEGVVGGLGAPTNTWALDGDGVTKTFSIPGATSLSQASYTVEIDGVPVQRDPNHVPGPPTGGGFDGGGRGGTSPYDVYQP